MPERPDVIKVLEERERLSSEEVRFLEKIRRLPPEAELYPRQVRKLHAIKVRLGHVEPPPKRRRRIGR